MFWRLPKSEKKLILTRFFFHRIFFRIFQKEEDLFIIKSKFCRDIFNQIFRLINSRFHMIKNTSNKKMHQVNTWNYQKFVQFH